jgi:hypothetical protein
VLEERDVGKGAIRRVDDAGIGPLANNTFKFRAADGVIKAEGWRESKEVEQDSNSRMFVVGAVNV